MIELNRQRRRPSTRAVVAAAALSVGTVGLACGSSDGDRSDGERAATTTTAPDQRATPTTSAAPTGELPEETQAALQTALEATLAEHNVPGAAVGVWVPGEGAWVRAVGASDLEARQQTTPEMTWPLRSITTSYTVTLILQLADQGKVSLDDTIDQYVDGVTDGDQITLRQLADMSSGNADYTNDTFVETYTEDPTRIFTISDLNGFMLGEPAEFAPGTEYVYTNANPNLLGTVVEKVTGKPFEEVLDEQILQPLGLQSTQYVTDVQNWAEPRPVGYIVEDGVPTPQVQNLSILGAAGSMIGTLDDLRVWGEALATGSLLTPETHAERLDGHPLAEGPPYDRYALGIGETDGWWGHNGEGIGFSAAMFHNPETGATIVVFMNTSNTPTKAHPADQMFRKAARILGAA